MIIGIDIDNVIVNTTEAMLKYINERLPVNLSLTDIKEYSIEKFVPAPFDWIVENGFRDKSFWKQVQMIPMAAKMIRRLYEEGHELYFVTSSLPENLRKKIKHLTRNTGLPIEYVDAHVVNIQRKQLLKLDVLIDDCYDNIIGGDYFGICYKYPWNWNRGEHSNIKFAENWQQIYNLIQQIK